MTISFLRLHRLLAQSMTCSRCGTAMHEAIRSDISMEYDGGVGLLQDKQEHKGKQFFAKSRLPLQKWLLLMYPWARDYPSKDVRSSGG